MTEAEKLQEDCKLIATHIHGWTEHTIGPGFSVSFEPLYKETHMPEHQAYVTLTGKELRIHWTVLEFKPYEDTPLSAFQSLAVLEKLRELDIDFFISWDSGDKYVDCEIGKTDVDPSLCAFAQEEKIIITVFKACVKASEWIRDNQEGKK